MRRAFATVAFRGEADSPLGSPRVPAMDESAAVAPGRLSPAEYDRNFEDVKPPLEHREVLVETSRCHFCYDAPCIEACPTGIDIPGFIRKIGSGNLKGAAIDI